MWGISKALHAGTRHSGLGAGRCEHLTARAGALNRVAHAVASVASTLGVWSRGRGRCPSEPCPRVPEARNFAFRAHGLHVQRGNWPSSREAAPRARTLAPGLWGDAATLCGMSVPCADPGPAGAARVQSLADPPDRGSRVLAARPGMSRVECGGRAGAVAPRGRLRLQMRPLRGHLALKARTSEFLWWVVAVHAWDSPPGRNLDFGVRGRSVRAVCGSAGTGP